MAANRIICGKYNAKQFFEITADLEGRYELINGQIKLMASPNVSHQNIVLALGRKIGNYLEGKPCRAFVAPLDVVLFEKDDKNEKDKEMENDAYTFEDKIKVNIFDDFAIDFKESNL